MSAHKKIPDLQALPQKIAAPFRLLLQNPNTPDAVLGGLPEELLPYVLIHPGISLKRWEEHQGEHPYIAWHNPALPMWTLEDPYLLGRLCSTNACLAWWDAILGDMRALPRRIVWYEGLKFFLPYVPSPWPNKYPSWSAENAAQALELAYRRKDWEHLRPAKVGLSVGQDWQHVLGFDSIDSISHLTDITRGCEAVTGINHWRLARDLAQHLFVKIFLTDPLR